PSADNVYTISPKAMNASGQIAGVGSIAGDGKGQRAVILTPCEVSVSGEPIHFPAAGGVASGRIHAPPGCRARVTAPSYFQTSVSGPGDGLISITASESNSTSALTSRIIIGNTTIAITQDARPANLNCTYSLSASRTRFSTAQGFLDLNVTAPAG